MHRQMLEGSNGHPPVIDYDYYKRRAHELRAEAINDFFAYLWRALWPAHGRRAEIAIGGCR